MNLALVSAYDATLATAAPVPGPASLCWADAPPEGLTHQDLTRITAAIAAGRAESTRRTYAWQWGRFERWCAGRGITAMPATPTTMCAYLADSPLRASPPAPSSAPAPRSLPPTRPKDR